MPSFNFNSAFIRTTYEQVATEGSLYKTALWNSGVITNDSSLAASVGAGDGRLFTKRFYRDLPDPDDSATNGPTYPDDSDNLVPTHNLPDAEFKVTKNGPVASWDLKAIARRFNFMSDPMGVVSSLLGEYWGKYYDKYAIASMTGILADNADNDGGDMIVDISDAASAPDPTNTIQNDTVIAAEATAGDAANFRTIVLHSRVYNNLRIQNLIDFIPSARGEVDFALYQGKIVIVSDQVPVDLGGANPVYTTYVLGVDVYRYGASLSTGEDESIIGFEQWRDPRQGLGAGQDQIISRVQFGLHPVGFDWLDVTVTGSRSVGANPPGDVNDQPIYPNLADLRLAANWDRIASDRKHIQIAAILSNG